VRGLKNQYAKKNAGTMRAPREEDRHWPVGKDIANLELSNHCRQTFNKQTKKGNPGEIGTGVPYTNHAAASDGSPSAALEQPHLITTTHWITSFR
jgi:hypothetical protein